VTAEQSPPPAADVPADPPPTPVPDVTTPDPAPVLPPTPPGEPGTAVHCLHVGPERRVVQCYWTRDSCEGQIAFNRESGVEKEQVCNSYARAFCTLPSNSSEMCFPTTEDCERTVANMQKRNRQTTACTAKTGP
jgi:hypothetical protein